MSGPKVVRIVTREEIIALCEGHLARADTALKDWIRVGRRNDCVSEVEVAQAEGRIARLRALLKTDKFMDVQKQAPREIAFLYQDLQGRLDKVAGEAAKARSAARRQGDAAAALLKALKSRHIALDPELEAALHRATAGQADPRVLARGFALLSAETASDSTERRALAQSLKDGEDSRALADWVANQHLSPADPLLARLETHLAELALLVTPDVIGQFEARMRAVADADIEQRKRLLLDSLQLDVSSTLIEARKRAALSQELRLTLAELALIDAEAERAIAARAGAADAAFSDLLAETQAALRLRRDAQAAEARRAAVLQSLAGLGYEVGEGLATAWVDQRRVVLRRAAQPDYGVEISGDPAGARMQMRVVAFGDGETGPDSSGDKDAETLWCGDVAVLQKSLANAGGQLVIERALPVGAAPVKHVALPQGAKSRTARDGSAQQKRTLS